MGIIGMSEIFIVFIGVLLVLLNCFNLYYLYKNHIARKDELFGNEAVLEKIEELRLTLLDRPSYLTSGLVQLEKGGKYALMVTPPINDEELRSLEAFFKDQEAELAIIVK